MAILALTNPNLGGDVSGIEQSVAVKRRFLVGAATPAVWVLVSIAGPVVVDAQEAPDVAAEAADQSNAAAREVGGKEEEPEGWRLSGIINRVALGWNDGSQQAVYSVDNPQDSTGFTLEYNRSYDSGWEAGLGARLDTDFAGADTVDQLDSNGTGTVVELSSLFASAGRADIGQFVVGLQDSASDEIDNINLTGADAVADASFGNFADGFFLRAEGLTGDSGLASGLPDAFNADGGELRWGDLIDGKLAGASGLFVTYVTPQWNGLELAASVGQPAEIFLAEDNNAPGFTPRTHGLYWDAALRYDSTIGMNFEIIAGVGYWNDTTEEDGATESTQDQGVAGSLAVRHVPTGLNLAVNLATASHDGHCEEPGLISGRCTGPDTVFSVRGGIVRDYFDWGSTALYGEFAKNWKHQHDSDEALVATLFSGEEAPEQAELQGSEFTGWGLGVVQRIEAANASVYAGFRHYSADFDLAGEDGRLPTRRFDDFTTVMIGITFFWDATLGVPAR